MLTKRGGDTRDPILDAAGCEVDPARCPLCGRPNDCVMASGEADEDAPCWCEIESFPRELLEWVPAVARDRVCICRKCHEKSSCATGSSSFKLGSSNDKNN